MDVYWLEQSEDDVPAGDDWLSSAEAARLSELRFLKRRSDWRRGRWTAKRALAAYLELPCDSALRNLEIRAAPSGAPQAFWANRPAPVVISLSHRGARAACAVGPAGAAVGCDLEIVEPRSGAFVADYFTAEEQDLVAHAPAAERPRLVTLLWSAKESGLKALGAGLRLDTRSIGVSAAGVEGGHSDWRPLCVRHVNGPTFRGWWQSTDELLRTVVALPSPQPPVLLVESCLAQADGSAILSFADVR